MAIDPSTVYSPTQIDASDPTGYPLGAARNDTVPGDQTGTPLEKTWLNDVWGFFQAILARRGVTPSGTPDKVGASQLLTALSPVTVTHTTAATAVAFPTGATHVRGRICGNGGGGGGGKNTDGGGGGGGSGYYTEFYAKISDLGATYDITFGSVGTGGAADTDGVTGGAVAFVSGVFRAFANGGQGGGSYTSNRGGDGYSGGGGRGGDSGSSGGPGVSGSNPGDGQYWAAGTTPKWGFGVLGGEGASGGAGGPGAIPGGPGAADEDGAPGGRGYGGGGAGGSVSGGTPGTDGALGVVVLEFEFRV